MASGDELLKNHSINALNGSSGSGNINNELTVTTGHTFTVLSFTINERAGNAETFSTYVDTSNNNSGTDLYIYTDQDLPAKGTFEHTSKIILTAGQRLGVLSSAGDMDVFVSYLDQEL